MLTNLGGGVLAGEELIPSNNNLIEGNTIEESGGPGIAVVDSSGTQVVNNDVPQSNGAGIELELAHDTLVRGNDLTSSGAGIEVSESNGNRIEFNNAGSTLGSGISLELSFDNEVVDNIASSNGGDGIEIGDTAPIGQSNLIERNTADANGGDGIIVEGAGHTLTANHVMLNGGWGIYAPVGAIDGGGNFAAGNMEPGQCFGIVCTRGATPGAPDTWFIEKPPAVSNSRNASFTYLGRDDVDAAREPRVRVPPRQHQRPRVGGLRVPARDPQPQPGPAHARDPRDRPEPDRRRHAREVHVDVRAAAGERPARGRSST